MSEVAARDGMLCPVCTVDLVMTERQGIEIDYCPKCRGVWLDRGELDKIIERSGQYAGPAPQEAPPRTQAPTQSPWFAAGGPAPSYGATPPPGWGAGSGHEYEHQHGHGDRGSHGRHRRSWLGDLFD